MSSTFTSTADTSPAVDHTLQHCGSVSSLRAALGALCRTHGELRRLDVVAAAQGGRRQALCFMRLETPEQEQSLMRALGIGRFGGELVLVVSLANTEHLQAGPRSPTVSVSVLPVELGEAEGALEFQRWSDPMADRPTQAGRQH